MKTAGITASLVLFGVAAIAQEPAPEPLPAEVRANVAAMNCPQPPIPERFSLPREDIAFLYKRANDYADCVSAYVNARQEKMKQYNDLGRAEAEAANAAIAEINDYKARLKQFDEKHNTKKN